MSVATTSQAKVSGVHAVDVAPGQHHGRHRRDEQQLDDARLGERDVGADQVAARLAGGSQSRPSPDDHLFAGRVTAASDDRHACAVPAVQGRRPRAGPR